MIHPTKQCIYKHYTNKKVLQNFKSSATNLKVLSGRDSHNYKISQNVRIIVKSKSTASLIYLIAGGQSKPIINSYFINLQIV